MTTPEKAQAAQTIVACSAAARDAMRDPQWKRRMHHGDPTAVSDLVLQVCSAQGLNGASVLATIKTDAALRALLQDTISEAQRQGLQEHSATRYRRLALGFGIPLAIALGVFLWVAYYLHANDDAIKHITSHPAAPVGDPHPGPP